MFQLPPIGADGPQRRVMGEAQNDAFAHQPVHQMRQIRQCIPQVQDLRLQRLLAGKGQQLAHQRRRAVGVLRDLVQIGVIGVGLVPAQHQQVAMAGDRRQQVVEVMRDPARKLADGLHLLALHELRLQRLQGAGVRQHGHDAVGTGIAGQRDLDMAFGAVAAAVQDLAPAAVAAFAHLGQPVVQGPAQSVQQIPQEKPRCDRPKQRLGRAVGRPHMPLRIQIQQGNRQPVEIGGLGRVFLLFVRHGRQIELPALHPRSRQPVGREPRPVGQIEESAAAQMGTRQHRFGRGGRIGPELRHQMPHVPAQKVEPPGRRRRLRLHDAARIDQPGQIVAAIDVAPGAAQVAAGPEFFRQSFGRHHAAQQIPADRAGARHHHHAGRGGLRRRRQPQRAHSHRQHQQRHHGQAA